TARRRRDPVGEMPAALRRTEDETSGKLRTLTGAEGPVTRSLVLHSRGSGVIMGSVKRRYSKEEFARRGDAIYENDVRPRLKPADEGKFAAIDIESGAFELDRDEMKAGNRLRARIPDAQIWMVRVGHRAVHRVGGRVRRE